MAVLRRVAILGFNIVLFYLLWSVYAPRQGAWRDAPAWGSATPEVRAAVVGQLRAFQEGYSRRNPAAVPAFVSTLFSRDHPLVLGTMPREIFAGSERVAEVIRNDWESWGDCRFRVDESHVSAAGDVAWFATVGSVTFDLSRFLVLPLRLTGVMVNEGGAWRIRQAQFQFDLDLSGLLLVDLLLLAWMAVNIGWLAVVIVRWRPGRHAGDEGRAPGAARAHRGSSSEAT